MQYLVVHSVQGLLHAVTGVLSGLCQTSHTVSQRQHYPGPCSAEGHTSHPPPASCLPRLATEGGEESNVVTVVLVVCLQIMIINFKPATFVSESTIEGAAEGTYWCRSHLGPGEVRGTTHLSFISQLCHHLQGTTLVWPARPSYLNKAVVSRWDGLARHTRHHTDT